MFQRAPKLLCADQGWVVARDDEHGRTEYLMAFKEGQNLHWCPSLDLAMTTKDHGAALEWLRVAEKH